MRLRLKQARKVLSLTQAEFGARLGVTDGAISNLEKGERNLTERMIRAICREFDIGEEWLRTGVGEMFIMSDNTIIATLASEFNLDTLDQKIVEAYLKLPEVRRAAVKDLFISFAQAIEIGEVKSMEEYITTHTVPAPVQKPPRPAPIETLNDLTEEEYVELHRQRFRAAKMGDASYNASEKQT